jgi:hypothetical protein
MSSWQARIELLSGEEKVKMLQSAHVLVVGLEGVGAYAAEMLCRAYRHASTKSNKKSRQKYPRTGFLFDSRTPMHGVQRGKLRVVIAKPVEAWGVRVSCPAPFDKFRVTTHMHR